MSVHEILIRHKLMLRFDLILSRKKKKKPKTEKNRTLTMYNNFCVSRCYDATILCFYVIALRYTEAILLSKSFRARGFDCPHHQTHNTFRSTRLYLSLWLNIQGTGKKAFFWCCIL